MNVSENIKEGAVRGLTQGLILAALAGFGSYMGAQIQMNEMKNGIANNHAAIQAEKEERLRSVERVELALQKIDEKNVIMHDKESTRVLETAQWRGAVDSKLESISQSLRYIRKSQP